jgi:signal transduction histidine kinase
MRASTMRGRLTAAFALGLALLMALVCAGLTWFARYAEERSAASLLRMGANKLRQEVAEEGALTDSATFVRQQTEELRKDGLIVLGPSATAPRGGVRTVRVSVGPTEMIVGLPWQPIEERLRSQAAMLAGLSLFGVAIGTAGAWFLVGRTLSPIAELSREAERTPADRLRVQLTAPSSDAEIALLVSTLNRLLDRQAEVVSAQARFYAAASHELRTPLHTLSGHLEVALSRSRSPEEYRGALDEASRQTARLCSLVKDLLMLTRLNTTPILPPAEPVNLREIVDAAIEQFSGEIDARRLVVRADWRGAATICAPRGHVEMLVRNLVENAIAYATPGCGVAVTAGTSADRVRLEIYNDCAPLGLADVDQLLEPFFRPDASRRSETGGNGLGLAICEAIVRADGWDLALSEEPTGFRVTVHFPNS